MSIIRVREAVKASTMVAALGSSMVFSTFTSSVSRVRQPEQKVPKQAFRFYDHSAVVNRMEGHGFVFLLDPKKRFYQAPGGTAVFGSSRIAAWQLFWNAYSRPDNE